jgi:ABC-type multidrug transport system fused ATPase/permease subunit
MEGTEEKKKARVKWSSLRKSMRILHFFRPYWPKFLIGMLTLVIGSGLSMLFPAMTGKLIDAINGKSFEFGNFHLDNVNDWALALIGVFGVQAILSFFRVYLFNDVTERVVKNLRETAYGHIIRMPMTFFAQNRVGELNSRLSSDVAQIQETFTIVLAEIVRQLIIVAIGIPALAFYSVKLTIIMLASVPVMIMIAVFMGRWVKKFSRVTQSSISDSNVIVEETLTAIQSVKAFTNEEYESERYSKRVEEVRKTAMKGVYARGGMSAFIIFAIFGSFIIVIWQAAVLMQQGAMSYGDLTTFLFYTIFVGASIGGGADLFARFQKGIGATEDLLELMENEPEKLRPTKDRLSPFNGDVAFENVSFSYPTRSDVPVLDGITFKASAGSRIALVGESGAGKSTLVSLLLQFYSPSEGIIKIDGKNASDYSLSNLRNEMAIVPQEVILFGGTIRENIAYGKTDATAQEIEEAAGKAHALEFIKSFPEGFETEVGERGIQLSGGQKQRVAIARALLHNPKILILDEATSSLDSESERQVQLALDELMKGRTSIVIAHRLSTIRKADQILVLQKGRIVERGTHEELMQLENGMYKNLSDLQMEV